MQREDHGVRRVLVAVLAVLGLVALLVGIGLRTVWLPDDTVAASASVPEPGLVVTTAPGVLEARPGPVTVTARAQGGGPVLLAVGRERDVEAYVDGLPRATLTGFDSQNVGRLTSSAQKGETPAEGQPALADPAASDLWVQRESGTGTATLVYEQPEGRWLLLAAGSGSSPAPDAVTLTWPQEVTTPWSTPLIVLGVAMLVASLLLAVLMVRSARGARQERA
jgi:hypothetical protein